jgi:hypothetical protein
MEMRGRSSQPRRGRATEHHKQQFERRCHGTLWWLPTMSGVDWARESEQGLQQKWPRKRAAWPAAVPAQDTSAQRIRHLVWKTVGKQLTALSGPELVWVVQPTRRHRRGRVGNSLLLLVRAAWPSRMNRASRPNCAAPIISSAVHPGATTQEKHLARTCDLSDTAETRVGWGGVCRPHHSTDVRCSKMYNLCSCTSGTNFQVPTGCQRTSFLGGRVMPGRTASFNRDLHNRPVLACA